MTLLLVQAALADAVLSEHFDGSSVPAGFVSVVGAKTGGGGASKLAIEDGALVARASKSTRRFMALETKLEVRGTPYLRITARIRAEGVDLANDPGGECGAYVRFEDGSFAATPRVVGTRDWTEATRLVKVPANANFMDVGLLLSAPGTAWFDDFVVEPVDPGWKTVTKDHFTYHWMPPDALDDGAVKANEAFYDQVTAFLGGGPKAAVHYHWYPSTQAKLDYTANEAPGHVADGAIFTTYRSDEADIARVVLAAAWGAPAPALAEGVVTHVIGSWDGKDTRLLVRGRIADGKAPALSGLLDPGAAGRLPADATHPVAAAFVLWLEQVKGHDAVKKVVTATRATATGAANIAAVEAALGAKLDAVDAEFRAWI